MMFERLLIANRGEIACRIASTARRMGIHSIAIYARQEAAARHVELCDEALLLQSAQSYLDGAAIIELALQSGAQAIHPGYGFLSENADFCDSCEQAGIRFIGPSAAAIRAMGSKIAAKQRMEQAGVPVTPGYFGDDQSDQTLMQQAEEIGFPLLVKASSGGGGRGMRVVENHAAMAAALTSCRREAQTHFNDDRLLLERYLPDARHIEFQIFADQHGHTVHLFERDCSLQRRHQKVIEQAPAAHFSADLRAQMGRAAIQAAEAIDYCGAGTVEFLLLEDGRFYFMEMNTRLQVEHPVTEMIGRLDLVEWQLRVASGEVLPKAPQTIHGHAIEARICAENSERDFLPDSGRLSVLRWPPQTHHCRIDSGVREGDEVSPQFDSMLAKLIVWDETRAGAVRRLQTALAQTHLLGVSSNLSLLRELAAQVDLLQGQCTTRFIEHWLAQRVAPAMPNEVIIIAALFCYLSQRQQPGAEQDSPWSISDGWRMNLPAKIKVSLQYKKAQIDVEIEPQQDGFQLYFNDQSCLCQAQYHAQNLTLEIENRRIQAFVQQQGSKIVIDALDRVWSLSAIDPRQQTTVRTKSAGSLQAPMPGVIIDIKVNEGDMVQAGDDLLVLEAMKMEHSVIAPKNGFVERLFFCTGDQVQEGDELIRLGVCRV